MTAVGSDDLGKQAIELYKREGIDVSQIKVLDGVASGVALIFVAEDGENMIGVAPGSESKAHRGRYRSTCRNRCFARAMCYWSAWRSPCRPRSAHYGAGFEAEMHTILNPAPAPVISEPEVKELLSAAITITPNRVEALALAGLTEEPNVEPNWTSCGARLQSMGPKSVVITLGSHGCQVIAAEAWSIRAPRVVAVDTVGAGDAFNGALAAALADGWDMKRRSPGQAPRRLSQSHSLVPNRLCRFATRSINWPRRTTPLDQPRAP